MRRRRSTSKVVGAALAALLVSSACGSTVDRGAIGTTAGLDGEAGDGFDALGGADGNAGSDGAGTFGGGGDPALSGGASSPGSGTSSPGGGSGPRTGQPPGGGNRPPGWIPAGKGVQGVTDNRIVVGVWVRDYAAAGAFLESLGGAPRSGSLDGVKASHAVASYINDHGGVAGRRLELVHHQIGVDQERDYAAACAKWTEDHSVFAIMAAISQGVDCAKRSNRILVSDVTPGGVWASRRTMTESKGLWYGPTYPLVERRGATLVDGLVRHGWFTPGAKVGVLVEDTPTGKEGADNGMLPALARHEIEVAKKIVYPLAGAAWDTYAFDLFRAGVTHVLWSSSDGLFVPPLLMLQAATNQRYYPKWGFATDQGFGLGPQRNWPADQLPNISGIGWNVTLDTGATAMSGSKNAQACAAIRDKLQQVDVTFYCEMLFFLQHVLAHATEVSNAGFQAALDRVGTSYPSVHTVDGGTKFSAARHDGPVAYRIVGYDDRCTSGGLNCFKYVSPSHAW